MGKKCIVHIPNHLDPNLASGSQIRPLKMKTAFENIGYEVDFISGYGIDRRKQINRIKNRIKNGENYEFVYAESSTMPTLLTEKNHIPLYPFLDFGFYSFCKKHNLPIGLFYRDIYWKFPAYKESVKGPRRIIAMEAYKYDLRKYDKYLSQLFVPSLLMVGYIGHKKLSSIAHALPPGANMLQEELDIKDEYYKNRINNYDGSLRLFYVGGIGNHYKFDELIRGVSKLDNIYLTICCREKEWQESSSNLAPYLNDRIKVVHESGVELAKYYRQADICLAYFQQDEYRKMAMPIKLFEYLSFTVPVVTTDRTAAGKFVKDNDIGWCIEYGEDNIHLLFKKLSENFEEVVQKHEKSKENLKNNTWECRAMEAAALLNNCK